MMRGKKKHIDTDVLIYFGLGYASVAFPDRSVAAPSKRVVIHANVHTDRFPIGSVAFFGPVVIQSKVWERITERIELLSFERLEIRQAIGNKDIGFLRAIANSILDYAYASTGVKSDIKDPFPNRKKGWNTKGTL